ncbi:MAG: rhodanese-like domain-containing protein [Deltaproteobacteria bacterium]|nr:rhodanese-like domain-containing protein [Deltaproteobacteria bacterium]
MEKVLKQLTMSFFGMGRHKITPEKFLAMENAVLLDVRSEKEVATLAFGLKHHRNIEVLNIPLDLLPARIAEIPKGKPIALFCSTVVRSAIAYAYLLEQGFSEARILEGGYATLVEALKPGRVLDVLQGEE